MTKRTEIATESQAIRTEVADLSHLDRTVGRYAGTQVATDLGIAESSIRNWFTKLCQCCPSEWLKVSGRYTDLAAALFADYAQRVSKGNIPPEVWIAEIKATLESYPVTVEVLPEASTALACNDQTANAMDAYLERLGAEKVVALQKLDAMSDAFEADEMAYFQAELEAAREKGAKKAAILHAVEKDSQNRSLQELRQHDIARKQGGQA